MLLTCSSPASAESSLITGRWQLDADISTNSQDELKGIRKSKRKKRHEPEPAARSGPGSDTQARYWQQANEGEQWQHSRELEHAGPMQRLLESDNLEILATENGFLFIYADGYERKIVPNPGGRVFTASGEELVKSHVGYTLAYWKERDLVFETRIKGGGKLSERITTSQDGAKLTVNIEIDRRDWKWIAKVDRIYDRVAIDPISMQIK